MSHSVALQRKQQLGEEIANAVSHGIAALLAIVGTVFAVIKSVESSSNVSIVSASIYGASLIILYLFSCLYHSITAEKVKRFFRVLDHCSIFLLILGTYVPITLVVIGGIFGWSILTVLTVCAVWGIVLNSVNLERFRKLSMLLYIAMGWMVVLALRNLFQEIPFEGVLLLIAGGVFYTLGVFFYKKKEIKYMHFVWHLFVMAGSVSHFYMIYLYCL